MIVEQDIIDAGHTEYSVIDKNIFLIKNFISESECDSIINVINKLSESDWNKFDVYQEDNGWKHRLYDHGIIQIEDGLKSRVEKIFSKMNNPYAIPYKIILRQFPGGKMIPHADDDYEPATKLTRKRLSAAIIYLNDDYSGGELNFVKKNIKIKPPARSLMLFETGDENIHEVKKVEGDIARYCLPSFVFIDLPL
jgi:hypothetical protein